MRLIFDEDLPRDLLPLFESGDDEVVHVEDLGWKGISNGDLLSRISGKYDVLVTGDTNMRYQQNLAGYDVAVIVLRPQIKVLDQLVALGRFVPGCPAGARRTDQPLHRRAGGRAASGAPITSSARRPRRGHGADPQCRPATDHRPPMAEAQTPRSGDLTRAG